MKAYLELLTAIEDELNASPFVNSVGFGDEFDLDNSKQSMFPIAQYFVGDGAYQGAVLQFPVNLMVCGLAYEGDGDYKYILAETLTVIIKVLEVLSRGDLFSEPIQLDGQPGFNAFRERGTNDMYGWECTFNVLLPNLMPNTSEQT